MKLVVQLEYAECGNLEDIYVCIILHTESRVCDSFVKNLKTGYLLEKLVILNTFVITYGLGN